MKERLREKIKGLNIESSDTISLEYVDADGKTHVACQEKIGRKMHLNEAVIFDVEKGDFGEDTVDGIGGAFLSVKKSR